MAKYTKLALSITYMEAENLGSTTVKYKTNGINKQVISKIY
jgi:hypothetical protein